MNRGRLFKKSQGEIISTVLLILLVVVASVVLVSFVVPLVKNILAGSKCNDFNGKVYFTNNEKYSCYNESGKKLSLQVKFDGTFEDESLDLIKGIRIITYTSGGDSQAFDILPPDSNPSMSVVMYNETMPLELPDKNEEKTYIISNINSRPNSTVVYPILNGTQSCVGTAYTANYLPFCK